MNPYQVVRKLRSAFKSTEQTALPDWPVDFVAYTELYATGQWRCFCSDFTFLKTLYLQADSWFNVPDLVNAVSLTQDRFYFVTLASPLPAVLQQLAKQFEPIGLYHLLLRFEWDCQGYWRGFWLASRQPDPVVNSDYLAVLGEIELWTKQVGRDMARVYPVFQQLPYLGELQPVTFPPLKPPELRFSEEVDVILTARQKQVIVLLLEGLTTKAMAQALGITVRGVENHLDAIKNKFYCEKRYEILYYLLRHRKVVWL